jgi:two-component system, chemotaxis family, sensor kinase CheA
MSTIDLGRFHQTFFDESAEGLDVMEAALLQLTPDGADAETVNSIFRAAHSIKGGAATFGFTAVAGFTHLLETLLDQLRSGARAVSPVEIDVLLRSVDILRGLLDGARAGRGGGGRRAKNDKTKQPEPPSCANCSMARPWPPMLPPSRSPRP